MPTRQTTSFVGLFAALTGIGAFLSFPLPFTPVPFTLQLTFTAMAGVILGPKYGAISQLVYLLLGGIGLPVFGNRMAGFAHLVGPTAGYLWGFVLAAWCIGTLYQRWKPQTVLALFFTLVCGLLVVYVAGMVGLMLVVQLSPKQALLSGVIPFVVFDLFKILIAAYLVRKLQSTISFHTSSRSA